MSEETVRLRGPGLAWRDAEGEIVALDLESSLYLAANRSGSRLWRALAGGATRQQLVHLLVDGYGITPERAAADVETFLSALAAQGLLAGQC
jgi:hypothetical protein